ncbi:hypothetical protein BJX66DRAFT_292872 [Aspergillus keveii]|uniref:Uncharacterized protein n=1 Tax=Aspergillus keveii TaxID=714993 RepID=A0ABR4GLF8_9EURO
MSSLPQIKTRELKTSSSTLLFIQTSVLHCSFLNNPYPLKAQPPNIQTPKTLKGPRLQLPLPMSQWKKTKHKRGTKRKSRNRGMHLAPSPNIMARLQGRRGQRPRRAGPPLTHALILQRFRALLIFSSIVVAVIWQIIIVFHHLAHISRFVRALNSRGDHIWFGVSSIFYGVFLVS